MDSLRFDSNGFEKIIQGNDFVKYRGVIAKPGVLVYENPDGTKRREFLPPEELFANDSIESFKGLPITDEHPIEGVSSMNYNQFTKGAIGNVYEDKGVLIGEFTVYDPALNEKISSGEKVELSIGRRMALDLKSGVFNNSPFDAVQRNIRANHLAITKQSRTGRDVRITERFDSIAFLLKENEMDEIKDPKLPLEVMYRADSDGKDYKVPRAVSDDIAVKKAKLKEQDDTVKEKDRALKKLNEELELLKENQSVSDEIKALTKKIDELNSSKAIAEKEASAWKEKFEKAESENPKKIEEAAKERVKLVETAKAVLANDSAGIDQLSNDQIKDKVIAKVLPYDEGLRMDSITSEIRNAHFEAALRLAGQRAAENPKPTVTETRNDSVEDYRLNMHNYKGE